MELRDVGEKSLLDLARNICDEGPDVVVGVGDDGAAVRIDGNLLVSSTDMLIEGVHFISGTSPERIGRKAVVTNLSDLAAMGADALGLVYSVGAPKDKDVDFISGLLRGMNSTALEYGTYLVGGDLNQSDKVILAGTAFGKSKEDEILLRSGAEPGDVIGLTGEIGAAASATRIILEDLSLKGDESLKEIETVARLKEGRILSENGKVTSAIDVTDGLASNLWQISRMSDVKITIDFEKIPVSKIANNLSKEQGIELDELVLYGGEDFELLFTAKPEAWEDLKAKFQEIGTKVSKIGKVEANEGVYIKRENGLEKLPDKGYEHFKEQ